MGNSLLQIPGARRPRVAPLERRRTDRRPPRLAPRPAVLIDPRAGLVRGAARRRLFNRPRRVALIDIGIGLGALVLVAMGVRWAWGSTRVHADVTGLRDGARLTRPAAEHLQVAIRVSPAAKVARSHLTLDGRAVEADVVETHGAVIRWRPEQLTEGRHRLGVAVPRDVVGQARFGWSFTVDGTPPVIDLPRQLSPAALDRPVVIAGRVESDVSLRADGRPVKIDDGRFTLRYHRPPPAPVMLVATDPTGNRVKREVVVPVRYPQGSHAVHVTAAAWGYAPLRAGVLDLVDRHLVNAVELDLKDEGGIVGYNSKVPAAVAAGAVSNQYDLRAVVDLLHRKGVRVIGRLVAFRDPVLAKVAWDRGQRDAVVQSPDGAMFVGKGYKGFTNVADPWVRKYNIDIAAEAARAGVDDVLYDYVRRPDGGLDTMRFPGLRGTPSAAVVRFLAESRPRLHAYGAFQGASVFGIAADRPNAIAQPIPAIARHTDYISPMVYPSHWVSGEYRVPDPIRQPAAITSASLRDFKRKAAGTGVALAPWLQDFSLYGVHYGVPEVRAQIDAAARLGIDSFLLWNPGVRYTTGALAGPN